MRRTSFALGALALMLTAGSAEAQTLKIGYINSRRIFDGSSGRSNPRRIAHRRSL